MSKYYSPSLNGFFDDDIHGDKKPADIVELTDEEYHGLLEAQSQGRRIVRGHGNRPIAVERVPTPEELASMRLRQRNQGLTATDAIVSRHRDEVELGMPTTLTQEQYRALQVWRAQLRDLPANPRWPDLEIPERPV